jgi:hypothetical protein
MLFLLWLADITLSFTQGLLFVAGSSAWANRSISLLDLLGTGAICGQYQGRHSWKLAVLLAGINQGDISCIWCDTCGWNPTSLSVNYCALLVSAAQIYIFDNRWHILYYGVCSVFVAFTPCYVSHISEPAWHRFVGSSKNLFTIFHVCLHQCWHTWKAFENGHNQQIYLSRYPVCHLKWWSYVEM